MDPQEMSNGQVQRAPVQPPRPRTNRRLSRRRGPHLSGFLARPHAGHIEQWPHGTCIGLKDPAVMWMLPCDGASSNETASNQVLNTSDPWTRSSQSCQDCAWVKSVGSGDHARSRLESTAACQVDA